MAYQAIYRKWRPLSFEDVVGQKHVTDTLKTELTSGRIAHAYLFCGTRGTGKTTTAKILSRAMNCQSPLPNGNPCNECASCTGILNGSIMDVVEIDAASNNGVDNIRELRDEISYTPANTKYKIYIIDEVHMLSTGAFNALLKTLEEPPAHVIFILATTEPHKIPATIQSRCQRFDFRRISAANIAGRIGEITRKDGIQISQDAISLVAQLGDGSMRDALSVLDLCAGIEGEITRADIENIAGVAGSEALYAIAQALASRRAADAITLVSQAVNQGRDPVNLPGELLSFYRELLICKIVPTPSQVLDKSDEALQQSRQLAEQLSEEALLHTVRTLSDTVTLCKVSPNPQVLLETAIMKICHPQLDATTEAFAARVQALEAAVLTGNTSQLDAQPQRTEPPAAPVAPVAAKIQQPEVASPQPSVPQPAAPQAEELPPPPDEPPQAASSNVPPPMQQAAVPPPPPPQPATQPAPAEHSGTGGDYQELCRALLRQNPPIGALLQGTTLKQHDGVSHIQFASEALLYTAQNNPVFMDAVKKALNTQHIKLELVQDAQQQAARERDPLDEILELSNQLDQMTIF